MITEGKRSKLAIQELGKESNADQVSDKEGFDSLAEVRAEFIKEKCMEKGVFLVEKKLTDPISFITLQNERKDMASVSAQGAAFEPFLYCPEWGSYMKKWVLDEGFPEDVIESENLIRSVTLEEAVDFLCT